MRGFGDNSVQIDSSLKFDISQRFANKIVFGEPQEDDAKSTAEVRSAFKMKMLNKPSGGK